LYSNKYNKIAIMQPTFLPWVGYFALINAVDLFIFLDSVQFDKRSWQQRNIIKTINGSSWLTVPVISKGKFQQKINEVEILNDSNFNNKIIKKIYANYSKAKFFKLYSEDIFKIIIEENKMLSQLNYKLIKYFLKVWEIKTRLSYSSKLNVTGYKDELLYNILSSYKSELYVSPPGSETYLKESKFFGKQQNQKNYELFKFKHPEWSQLYGDFLPYCSAIDLLFNMGKEGKSIIESGYF
tara:strand:+ start:452 stop:1168 length:717 start_codon:yes stop_codon:yes gene_type:complete